MKDSKGNEINIGSYVHILNVDQNWFKAEPEDAYTKLQEALKKPLKVTDIYEGVASVQLPATKDHAGELVGNEFGAKGENLEVVQIS